MNPHPDDEPTRDSLDRGVDTGDDAPDEYEQTYPDGSAKNECW